MSFAKTIFHDMTLSELSDANYRLAVHGHEADALCNQLARAIVRRMRSEHNGTCWLVSMKNRTITPYTCGMVRNFDCDFVLPSYNDAVANALADLKEHGFREGVLDKLYALIHCINSTPIFWK